MGSPYLQPAIGSAPAYPQIPGNALDPLALQDPALSAETMDWQNAEMYDQNGNLIPLAPETAGYRVENEEPIKEEKPGFFEKIGATLKGVLDAPGKILDGLTDPKNLALLVGGIAVSVLFPPAAPFIAAAGIAMAGVGVAQGASAVASGWANDDLSTIREGSGIAAANGLGLALGAKGFKSSTVRNLRAAGIKRVKVKDMRGRVRNIKVDDISTWQAMRLQGKAFKGSMGKFKKDYARTKGSMPQRLVAVARRNMAGAPAGHRPRPRRTRAQRMAAGARLGVDVLRLVDGVARARVTPTTGTGAGTQVALTQALRNAYTSGGGGVLSGLRGVARTIGRDSGVYSALDPLVQRGLQVGARGLDDFGYGGRVSTGLRIASEGVGARTYFQNFRNAGVGLRDTFWTPLRTNSGAPLTSTSRIGRFFEESNNRLRGVAPGGGGPRTGGVQWGSATRHAWGTYDSAAAVFGQARTLGQVVTGRPGAAQMLANAQEQRAAINGIMGLYNRVRPSVSTVTPTGGGTPTVTRLTPGTRLGNDGIFYAAGNRMPSAVREVRTYTDPGTGAVTTIGRGGFELPTGTIGRAGFLNEAVGTFNNARNAFLGMTGRTTNIGNTVPNPGGPARFGRIGQQSSKAFEFVQAHPGAVQGSVPLPLATGIQSDIQKKYMEMAQMQQLALSGVQATA
jgi:hypothetical protein